MDKRQIKEDFQFLKKDDKVLALLLFGSQIKEKTHEKSDTDICIVAPDTNPQEILKQVFSKINTEKKKYDVHTFEEFTLRLKHYIIKDHEILWTKDKRKLQEYFYKYQKIWKDQAKARGIT